MPRGVHSRVIPGGTISADQQNEFQETSRRSNQIRATVGGTAGFHQGPFGTQLDQPDGPFWAILTSTPASSGSGGCGSTAGYGFGSGQCFPGYGWKKIFPDGCGGWIVPGDAEVGESCQLAAYEANGIIVEITTNGTPTVVQLWPDGLNQSYIFTAGGGGGDGSFIGPECIIAVSTQVCCNQTNGAYIGHVLYHVYVKRALYVFLDDRVAAIECHVANGGSGCTIGECPAND